MFINIWRLFIMAKKKTKELNKIITLAAAALGLIAFIMFFLPAIAIKDSESTYSGFQVIFGCKETMSSVLGSATVVYFQFSFMNLLTLVFLLAGIACMVLSIMGKEFKNLSLFAMIAFALAGLFFFLTVVFCVPGEEIESLVNGLGSLLGQKASVKDGLVLAAGSIIGGIVSILAAISLAYVNFIK